MPLESPSNLPINTSSGIVSNSPVTPLSRFSQATLPRPSVIEKIKAVASVVFFKAQYVSSKHPKIVFASLTVTALVGGSYAFYLYRKNQSLFSAQELAKIHAYTSSGQEEEAKKYVEKKVQAFLSSNKIVAQLDRKSQESFKDHLSKKIYQITTIPEALESSQLKMIENILANFSSLIGQVKKRVDLDSAQGKLNYLGIATGEKLKKMEVLGKETHCKGKIPFKLVFEKSKELIYKPRSMLPELLLCDEQQGLLRDFGFGTYRVLDCEDKGGGYGYCEFLKNLPAENIIDTREELLNYFQKLCVLEKIAERLAISDLHYLNIITSNKSPCLIDLEVFLIPNFAEASSGIFQPGNGAAFQFDGSEGLDPSFNGLNRLWFTDNYRQTILREQDNSELDKLEYGITKQHLMAAEIDVKSLLESTDMAQQCQSGEYEIKIEIVQNALKQTRGRVVLLTPV